MGFSVKGYREAAEQREATCEFGGSKFKLWYAPQLLTPKFEQQLNADIKGDAKTWWLVTHICHCILKWEVTDEFPVLDEDGKPMMGENGAPRTEERMVPLDVAHVSALPIEFLLAVVDALNKDQSPNATTPKPAGSFASG